MKPVLKWVGGKTQLLPELKKIITCESLEGHRFIEPFIGGGALSLELGHTPTLINDLNSELINLYNVIGKEPELLLDEIEKLKIGFSITGEPFYYEVRAWDKDPEFMTKYSDIQRAARTIFLNKTCFNGLYRVNSKGFFNSPIGRTSSGNLPNFVDEENIREISNFIRNSVTILNGDYKAAVAMAVEGDTVYLDPPYDYEDEHGFVGYQSGGWTRQNLKELHECCEQAVARGVTVVISNNDTSFVRDLFAGYEIVAISAKRNINCKGNNRNSGKELILYKRAH